MIFVGSKVFTHARYWQIKKYVCMIFFCVGGGGHREFVGGGTCPPPQAPAPRSYAPEYESAAKAHHIPMILHGGACWKLGGKLLKIANRDGDGVDL